MATVSGIHSLAKVTDQLFVSGPDLILWNDKGEQIRPLDIQNVTALSKTGNLWACGTSDGTVTFWNSEGKKQHSISLEKSTHCISKLFQGHYLIGEGNSVHFVDKELAESFQLDQGVCARSIQVLSKEEILVAFGPHLEVWKVQDLNLVEQACVLCTKEQAQLTGPDVSSVFSHDSTRCVVGFEGGTLKAIDLTAQKPTATFQERSQTRSVIHLSPDSFASGSDQGVKLWDLRTNKSVQAIGERVFSLLQWNDSELIVGSTDHVMRWDLRKALPNGTRF